MPSQPARSILVIDDNADICDMLCSLAEEHGHAAGACPNAPAVRQALDGPLPDLLFVDLMMPGLDGIEVLRLLSDRGCRARIVMVSGSDPRLLETAVRLGRALGLDIIEGLSKPFDSAELDRLMRFEGG